MAYMLTLFSSCWYVVSCCAPFIISVFVIVFIEGPLSGARDYAKTLPYIQPLVQ